MGTITNSDRPRQQLAVAGQWAVFIGGLPKLEIQGWDAETNTASLSPTSGTGDIFTFPAYSRAPTRYEYLTSGRWTSVTVAVISPPS